MCCSIIAGGIGAAIIYWPVFEPIFFPKYTLTIGESNGGTTDPAPGSYKYSEGAEVSIKAIPDEGWEFSHWKNSLDLNDNPLNITIESNRTITPYFKKSYDGGGGGGGGDDDDDNDEPVKRYLTIYKTGQGTTDPVPGTHSYTDGDKIEITAIPDEDWEFDHWSGYASGSQNPITLTMDYDKYVRAYFVSTLCSLTIDTVGQGTTDPVPGTHDYTEGDQVQITAIPEQDWEFDHWSGGASGDQNPITVSIDSDTAVTAHFSSQIPYSLTINRVGEQGLTDPAIGTHNYLGGSQVEITAINDQDWTFDHWSGDASGSQNPITVAIDSDKDITAHFVPTYRVYGLDFSPYIEDNQDPNLGTVITEEQIRDLMTTISPYTHWVRTFGSTNGLENAGKVAHELNLQIAAGAWLSDDLDANAEQIANLISIAQNGEADILIVGSEVLLRGDLTESQLLNYINQVKTAVPGIPVATADVYSELLSHPNVMTASDIILPNYYPYWEGISIEYAVYFVHIHHQDIVAAAGGKQVIVSETGWPSEGNQIGDAVASSDNAAGYFLNFVSWARDENVDFFYFEAFDEPWKAQYEGPQGAHWGVWDKDGNMKPGMEAVFKGITVPSNWDIPGGPGEPAIEFTYVPPIGSSNNLRGQVWHVVTADYRVAVYIKVEGGWWTKPYFNNPLTIILQDGSWTCDITTGGIDSQATEVIAFLVPKTYDPPPKSGSSTLPSELYDFPYVSATR